MNLFQEQVTLIARTTLPTRGCIQSILLAKEFIQLHYSERISMHDLAQVAGLSKFHFLRLFKQYCGISAHQYLTSVRIQAARKFLNKGLPVTEVCVRVGFDSPTTFAGLFKRVTGRAPSKINQESQSRMLACPNWTLNNKQH
jgi:transcriptional regulator GlxA family with amidase domain